MRLQLKDVEREDKLKAKEYWIKQAVIEIIKTKEAEFKDKLRAQDLKYTIHNDKYFLQIFNIVSVVQLFLLYQVILIY